MLDAMLAFIDAVIPGQRFVLAGLSYGGLLARGVIHHRAAMIDGVMLCIPQVKEDLEQAQLPPRTPLVENPELAATLGPGSSLIVMQTPRVVEAAREIFTEVGLADHDFLDKLEAAGPFRFDVDALPAPFGGPALIVTGRQDNLCGFRDAWNLLDNYPRATFAVLDGAGHLLNIEQDALCRALMSEWLDRVEQATAM
jgi:pimeloyl-ACP methyl ester carboxylesterase